jgi:hypothetical protein
MNESSQRLTREKRSVPFSGTPLETLRRRARKWALTPFSAGRRIAKRALTPLLAGAVLAAGTASAQDAVKVGLVVPL